MTTASSVITNPDRVAALRRLVLLDTPPSAAFDRITHLAARVIGAPIALITLVDANRQFFLSSSGLPEPVSSARQSPLEYSICQHAVAAGRPLIVNDTRSEAALAGSAAVIDLGVTAYAGIPLMTPAGYAIGTLCVVDVVPREWTDDQVTLLSDLADLTMDEIRLHVHDRIAALRRDWRGIDQRWSRP
jgi:GAF domain-containing protein